jgi:hypothetical protein
MRLINEQVLDHARGPGKCRWCGRTVSRREPHHILTRGAGRVDVAANIVALCAAFSGGMDCHSSFHDGNEPTTADLLAVSAADHGCQQDDICSLVYLIRRLDKRTTEEGFVRAVREAGFNRSATALAMRELESFRGVVWNKRRSAG